MRILKYLLCLILVVGMQANKAYASHAMGAHISYTCLGGDSFLVALYFLRDCDGIDAATSAMISYRSDSCGFSNVNVSLALQGSSEVSPVCNSMLSNTTCNGGALPGVELYTYTGLIVLPAQCADWVLSYSLCCRNAATTTLSTPASYDLYVESSINNSGGLCNSSPVFNQNAAFVCAGLPATLNFGGCDPDGDSLVYTSVCPLDGPGVCISYNGNFSPAQPLSTIGTFSLNPETGLMSFVPDIPQTSAVAVLVEEYRNGMLIGTTTTDMQIIVVPCNTNAPTITGIQSNTGGTLVDSITISACPGENISFQYSASDIDTGNILSLTSNIPSCFLGAALTTTSAGNNMSGTFSWTPTAADAGTHYLSVTATDNTCPVGASVSAIFKIIVHPGVYAGADQYYCLAGSPVRLNAVGGTVFTWSPSTGLTDSTISNPLAAPTVTTTYTVTSNLSAPCNNTDTVVVYVVPDFNMQVTADQDTICGNGATMLHVTADQQGAPYTYSWSPATSLINPASANPAATPQVTTLYTVAVSSAGGCTQTGTVTVHVNDFAPRVTITADKNKVCAGDTVQLTGTIYPLACGPSPQSCLPGNLPVAKTFGDIGAAQFSGTPLAGSLEDAKYQALYLASDLLAEGVTSGTIVGIELEVASKASTGIYQNFTITMGCTDLTELNTAGWLTNGTVVYAPGVLSTQLGSNYFHFTTPYDWDGTSHLFIEICFNNPAFSSAGGNDQIMCRPAAYTASMRATGNNTQGCTLNPSFIYPQIPKTTFHICDPSIANYSFTWSPPGLGNGNTLTPKAAITEETIFTLTVADSICQGVDYLIVTIDTSFDIIAFGDTAICGAGAAQLNSRITGIAPPAIFPCGVNGTPCTTATDTAQIGTGSTSTGTGTPYEGFWEDARLQLLYRATEIQEDGITGPATISSIAFFVSQKTSTQPYSSFTIRMGCTNLNILPANNFVSGITDVVYGPVSYSTVTGWNVHVFSNPFDWDGVSNLIVEVCFDNSNFTNDDQVQATPSSGTVNYDFSDGTSGCTISTPTAANNRANARFTYCPAPGATTTISWQPANSLSDAAIANPLATISSTTTYHVTYDFMNGCRKQDSITVAVHPATINSTISNDTSVCSGSAVSLFVTGGNLYQWDSMPGLSCYNCNNPIASPAQTSVFGVTITDTVAQCSVHESVTVTVTATTLQLAPSTIFCAQDSILLDAGPNYTSYLWSTGANTRTIYVSTAGDYAVTATYQGLCQYSDTVHIDEHTDCVWPGDANHDGIANNLDVLSIGIGYGESGPIRPGATLNWTEQAAPNWQIALANGANYKHVDCNGDGQIFADDTLAISLNYGLTHAKGEMYGMAGDPLLYFITNADTLEQGELLSLEVYLGTDTLPVNNFFGIAFTIHYDNALVDDATLHYEAENSFAGTPGTDALVFDKMLASNSQVDLALTRINVTNADGWGHIGTLTLNIKDSITWNNDLTKALNFSLSNVMAIDELEVEIPISVEAKNLVVSREPIGVDEIGGEGGIVIYPNPARQNVFVASEDIIKEIAVLDVVGKTLLDVRNVASSNYNMDVSRLPNGNYMLKVSTERREYMKRVTIARN